MKNGEFKEWLTSNHIYSSKKLITDCVSRAARVEKAFQVTDCAFSFQSEFEKDGGAKFCRLISRRGQDIKAPVDLPIGTNQMDTLSSATKKYFTFLQSNK